MKAAEEIARRHVALQELLAKARAAARKDDGVLAILDAAMAQLAIEAAALRALSDAGVAVDPRPHFAAHARARLALFRMATSPSDSSAFEHSLRDLAEAFGDRPHHLAAQLERLGGPALARLDEELAALAAS
jgi:hypothetical protein